MVRASSSVHVRNTSCGNKDEYGRWNHEPAQQNESCTTDQDCCNLDPSYCDPDILKLDVCKNGRCDFNNAYTCQNGASCFPWEECKFDTRAGRTGCVPIGSCQASDPFRFGICPAVPFDGGTVATYCNNGECWRQ